MYLKKASIREGCQWFFGGMMIFLHNPHGMLLIFFFYFFAVGLFSTIPLVGHIIIMLIMPLTSVSFMEACRKVLLRQRVGPLTLISSIRNYNGLIRNRLLFMGLIYLILSIVMFCIALCMPSNKFTILLKFNPSLKEVNSISLDLRIALFMLLMIPVNMLFWFAPVLSAWHNIRIQQAIYISWLAIWRNISAFAVYNLLWFSLILIFSTAMGFLSQFLGDIASFIFPLSLALTAMIFCSFYATYLGCFGGIEMENIPKISKNETKKN